MHKCNANFLMLYLLWTQSLCFTFSWKIRYVMNSISTIYTIQQMENNIDNWTIDSHIVLVFSGCHNKITQIVWLKQQKLIFSKFWQLKVQDQGARMISGRWGIFSWLAAGAFFLSCHIVFPMWRERKRERLTV